MHIKKYIKNFEREFRKRHRKEFKKARAAGSNGWHARRGFTLIEILIVIGIIAILAAVVLVAINPSRQFKLARDSQRVSNVNSILNAIDQDMAEHGGTFMCSTTPMVIPATSTDIATHTSDPNGGIGLATCLVPDYIAAMPFDPSNPNANYSNAFMYDTRYYVSQSDQGRITVSANGEITPTISVTR